MRLPEVLCLLAVAACGHASAADPGDGDGRAALSACRLVGVEHVAWCGRLARPLDPQRPQGPSVDIHFALIPALARNKKPDPIVFFAGGPGQSAIALAGPVSRMLGRFSNRRDLLLVDQRGTGRSAPLNCEEDKPTQPLRDAADPARRAEQWQRCRLELARLPHGDLRQFTTTIAMQDIDAVRRSLGIDRLNLVGASYGTRAALEYLRQFPAQVRRLVIDGVVPPDMVLPMSFSTDAQSAFDALLESCTQDADCRREHPNLREQWQSLWRRLPLEVTLQHPVTLQDERLSLSRDMLASMVRVPLYSPVLASALPMAIGEAARGRFAPLAGLASSLAGGSASRIAQGMHFAVVCAEDMPRLGRTADRPGRDFGPMALQMYGQACAGWPQGSVPEAFYRLPVSPAPTLLLSGAIDPVTPRRHGERVAQALGARARHVVVPNSGHGVLTLGCMRDLVFRFIDAEDGDLALQQLDPGCLRSIPRPPAFVPPRPQGRP